MRYENWDIILFPRDSHVPIQEFKTACYVAHDDYGRPLPTLTCFIASLPPGTPFRVSIHSWTKPSPTSVIESRRKSHQRVVYTIWVVIDGARVFDGVYELTHKWPQEIESEKQRTGFPAQQTGSSRNRALQFPPFRENVLLHNSWDARESAGRIKVFLAERLLNKTTSPGNPEFGAANDLVCFSFQHAPRDILEQAGIYWPVRNPLFLPSAASSRTPSTYTPTSLTRPHTTAPEKRQRSPLPKPRCPSFHRDSDKRRESNGDLFPKFPPGPNETLTGRDKRYAIYWDESFGDPYENPFDDDTSMPASWSSRQMSTTNTTNMSIPDYVLASPLSKPKPNKKSHGHAHEGDSGRSCEQRDIVMTLRDDQFGAFMEALSPTSRDRQTGRVLREGDRDGDNNLPLQQASLPHHPRGAQRKMPVSTKPSSAALARTASYPNLGNFGPPIGKFGVAHSHHPGNRNDAKSPYIRHSSRGSDKENIDPSRVPTPHPFPKNAYQAESVSGRDSSSAFSSLGRIEKSARTTQLPGRISPRPRPVSRSGVRSRKEGMGAGLGLGSDNTNTRLDSTRDRNMQDQETQQERMIFADTTVLDDTAAAPVASGNTAHHLSPDMDGIEESGNHDVINAATTTGFVPGHAAGEDSLGRIEKQLWNALGDELRVFGEAPVADMGAGPSNAGAGLTVDGEFVVGGGNGNGNRGGGGLSKRKRGDTMGGERGKSPELKLLKELQEMDMAGMLGEESVVGDGDDEELEDDAGE